MQSFISLLRRLILTYEMGLRAHFIWHITSVICETNNFKLLLFASK